MELLSSPPKKSGTRLKHTNLRPHDVTESLSADGKEALSHRFITGRDKHITD